MALDPVPMSQHRQPAVELVNCTYHRLSEIAVKIANRTMGAEVGAVAITFPLTDAPTCD